MKVELNFDNIRTYMSEIEMEIENYNAAVCNISNTISDMGSFWKYDQYNYFNSTMSEFISDLKKFQNSIESHNDLINSYINDEENLDNDYGSKEISIN